VKAQQFRSLAERRSKAGISLFACASVCALLFAAGAEAANSERVAEVKRLIRECKSSRSSSSLKLYLDEQRTKLDDKYNEDERCKHNTGGPESHNFKSMPRELFSLYRPPFFHLDAGKLGSCRTVYAAMKETYDHFAKEGAEYCQLSSKATYKFDDCKAGQDCKKAYEEAVQIFEKYETLFKNDLEAAGKYLRAALKGSTEAVEKYKEDEKVLGAKLREQSLSLAQSAAVNGSMAAEAFANLSHLPKSTIKASNGNGVTKTLREYYDLLGSPEVIHPNAPPAKVVRVAVASGNDAGPLISEHEEAGKQIVAFSTQLKEQVDNLLTAARESREHLAHLIATEDKYKSLNENPLDGIGKNGSTIASTAALGTNLLGANKGGPTGSSVNPMPLATLAAAGAAGAAFQNSIANASSAAASSAADSFSKAAGAGPTAPAVTKLTDGNEAGEKGAPSATDLTVNAKTDQPKADKPAESVSYPAFGAFDGSSRMISGTKKPTRAPAPAEGKVGESVGDETLKSFGGGMTPKPSPKSTQVNAGAEVANLLGQMKNLFSFDEGAPLGGGGSQPIGVAPVDPGAPAPAAEIAEADGLPSDSAEPGMEEGAAKGEESVQSAQFGRLDTTLFSRVHRRHTRCMEKGLVLYQLGERVE
jgi:hypothetical protein